MITFIYLINSFLYAVSLLLYLYQPIGDGIDRKPRNGVYLQLRRYITPVCGNGINRDIELLSDFFVGHTVYYLHENLFFSYR